MEYKRSCRLVNICLSISMAAALIVPLSFILTTTAMTDHVVHAYNVIKTVEDNYGQLNFVSTILTTTTNASSSQEICLFMLQIRKRLC